MSNSSSIRVRFGPYEADLRTHELWKYGTKVKLVGQPFAILEMLLERPGELITRDELRSRLWPGDTFVDFDHGLNAAVNKLRDALNDSAENPKYVETLPRRGYRFLGKVEPVAMAATLSGVPLEVSPESIPRVAEAPPQPLTESLENRKEEKKQRPPWTRVPVTVASAVLLVFLGSTLLYFHFNRSDEHQWREAKLKAERQTGGIGRNQGPQFSPDGSKVAFGSDRSGSSEVWISDRDGSNPRQFTNLRNCGTPRWSPDGKAIAFDRAESDNFHQIFVVPVNGGAPQQITKAAGDNAVPSWSHDGKWIYFASNRTGQHQVWKIPAAGGVPTQVTHNGGFAAFESEDGENLYYAKTRFPNPEIWHVPVRGGLESPLSPRIVPGTWASWGVSEKGLYFVAEQPGLPPRVSTLSFGTKKITDVTPLDRFPFFFAVSRDGKWLGYEESETQDGNIIVIANPTNR